MYPKPHLDPCVFNGGDLGGGGRQGAGGWLTGWCVAHERRVPDPRRPEMGIVPGGSVGGVCFGNHKTGASINDTQRRNEVVFCFFCTDGNAG